MLLAARHRIKARVPGPGRCRGPGSLLKPFSGESCHGRSSGSSRLRRFRAGALAEAPAAAGRPAGGADAPPVQRAAAAGRPCRRTGRQGTDAAGGVARPRRQRQQPEPGDRRLAPHTRRRCPGQPLHPDGAAQGFPLHRPGACCRRRCTAAAGRRRGSGTFEARPGAAPPATRARRCNGRRRVRRRLVVGPHGVGRQHHGLAGGAAFHQPRRRRRPRAGGHRHGRGTGRAAVQAARPGRALAGIGDALCRRPTGRSTRRRGTGRRLGGRRLGAARHPRPSRAGAPGAHARRHRGVERKLRHAGGRPVRAAGPHRRSRGAGADGRRGRVHAKRASTTAARAAPRRTSCT